jgi:hypothetical protein
MISDAKASTETLSVAEVAETVEYESMSPVVVLFCGDPDAKIPVFMYVIQAICDAVFHVQSHRF